MGIGFKEDKNGKIDDSDVFFDTLDELLDNEKYDEAISAIQSIPREKQSNKLRFRLICAYSDKREFQKAEAELAEIAPLCETPNDRARYRYLRGYVCYMNDKEISARRFYKEAAEIDPEYANEIKLADDIADCESLIKENLAVFRGMCGKARHDIGARCAQSSAKKKLSEEEFVMRLGFLPAVRLLPGEQTAPGFSGYFDRPGEEEAERTRQWFADLYGVTDTDSFFEHIGKCRECNLARMTDDVMSLLIGKPSFDIKDLNADGRFAFENSLIFVRQFAEFLPRGGTIAWDIGEKIGFARHAYRCGIIGEADYSRLMKLFENDAKKFLSSWEEYMISLVYGSAMYVYSMDGWNIMGAMRFVADLMGMLLNSDLGDIGWG